MKPVKTTPPKTRKVLVFSDIHVPNEDQLAISTLFNFIKDFQPDEIIINGDLCDFASISRHDSFHEELVKDDIDMVNYFLDVLREHAGDKCKIHYTLGNHDSRLITFVENNAPQLRGILTLEKSLNLESRGISFLPYAADKMHWITDKLACHHGFNHGTHFCKTTLDKVGVSIIISHTHRFQSFTAPTVGRNGHQVRGAWSTGCFVPVDHIGYMAAPPGWTQGFIVVMVDEETQNFNVTPVILINHKFTWVDGKIYGPSEGGWR